METDNERIIKQIRYRQKCRAMHPLTCRHGGAHRDLEPVERDGKVVLICLDCDYVQNWIPSAPNPEDDFFDKWCRSCMFINSCENYQERIKE